MSLVDSLSSIFRSGQAAQVLGAANANATAQRSADGIGIQNVRRGVMWVVLSGLGGNVTITSATFSALSTPLAGDIYLSGRPLRVSLGATAAWASSGGSFALDILLRGVSITGIANGIYFDSSPNGRGFHAQGLVVSPSPGRARIEVTGKATGTGTIATDASNSLVLVAEEL